MGPNLRWLFDGLRAVHKGVETPVLEHHVDERQHSLEDVRGRLVPEPVAVGPLWSRLPTRGQLRKI